MLKPMSAVKNLKIDPDVKRLFRNSITIDGALYPRNRGALKTCCADNKGNCKSKGDAEQSHGCYTNVYPNDFTSIPTRMGVRVGAGGYNDHMKQRFANYRKEGRNVRLILSSNDIDRVHRDKEFGNLLSIQSWDESHHPLLESPQKLARHLFTHGARMVQLAYSQSYNNKLPAWFAGGADQDQTPLTRLGRTLVKRLLDHYILIDVSHVGRKSALEIARIAKRRGRPITANHANATAIFNDTKSADNTQCRSGCKSRNHDDDVICAVARTGGAIGITPIRFMFAPEQNEEYVRADENDFLQHLDYVAKGIKCTKNSKPIQMINHVALGSDGNINGYHPKVKWLHMDMQNDPARWQRIATRLKQECGYSMKDIQKIAGGNMERVFRAALPGFQRPVSLLPRKSVGAAKKRVKFKWKRPRINQPKPKSILGSVQKPKRFKLVIHKRAGKTYSHYKTVKVGNKTAKSLTLPKGRYKWFVNASIGKTSVNSLWSHFERK